MEVLIDGKRYVPLKSSPSAKRILRALVETWWGKCSDADAARYAPSLFVKVTDDTDDSDGVPLEEFIARLFG